MSTNELVSKVRELKELQAVAEELQAEINSIQDAIKAKMSAISRQPNYKRHLNRVPCPQACRLHAARVDNQPRAGIRSIP